MRLNSGSLDIYRNKKALITGHTGFKGGWLALWLRKLGAEVLGYSLPAPTKPSFFESVALEKHIQHRIGDVRDHERLLAVVQEFQPEFVFHLAAQPLVRLAYREPRLTYETNVMGTVNVLEAIRQTESVRVGLIVTTDKCYENREWIYGYRENDPMGGHDPYSSSKGCSELVTAAYIRSFFSTDQHPASIASVRAGNVIGGGDWAADRLIPDCIRSLVAGETITIRSPHAVRPWQHVLEPLSGYLWLGARMAQDGNLFSGGWNFGPGDRDVVTVQQLVELMTQCWGAGRYEVVNNPGQEPHEAKLLKLDCSKAHGMLYWYPAYNVRQMMEETVRWYRAFHDGMAAEELHDISVQQIEEYTRKANEQDIAWARESREG